MPLRFTLRQMEYFVAVGECGSIALAAEKVNVSSPSISAAISQLEAEFGLQLFIRRHAHGLSLTQGGARFMTVAKELLDKAASLGDLANDISGQVRGPLNVGCLLTFAQIVLPQLRRSFVDAWPEVEFRQFERDQQELFDALRSARIDVALTYDLNVPADLEFIPLIELPPFALVHEAHELAHLDSVTPAELADYPMVLLDLPMSGDYFLSFFTKLGITPMIAERTRDIAVMRSLVANGFGYGMGNTHPATELAPDGRRLRFIPMTGPVRSLNLGLLMSEGARGSRTVRAFIEHAQAEITDVRAPGLQVRPKGA
ncbi:LysR family transcriptional regulator [Alloyangia pacifica]|uniref:DNA-binding transcriptional regulator, LysR family n=1 Tax=Alloyangia pacifica TaxID=311180 RepID=A0A1I6RT49_9RHOB|nr:LysR family transcriptional regulator [Alloyangia pacifica]SDG59477.1 DNA-binding transcriptional regulator, LysR family [Alloyangia pacifica]SFS67881.1 DNA-binding transcriptional regulator, LysR family [Alloyangia pacifica]